MTKPNKNSPGGFSAQVDIRGQTLSSVSIENFKLEDDILSLGWHHGPSKVPIHLEREMTLGISLDTSGTQASALNEIFQWYFEVANGDPFLINAKKSDATITVKKGKNTLFRVLLRGAFPKGLSFSDLTNPGKSQARIHLSYDDFSKKEVK